MKTIKMLMMAAFTILCLGVYAQADVKTNAEVTKQKKDKQTYSCPMHPSVTSDKPGKCSQCGMDMLKSPKEKMKMETMKTYTCPMHPEVKSAKAGKCDKCGMDLMRSPKEKMKMEVMKTYTCPMHPEITSDKPGKCSKCGMDLAKTKTKQKIN
jgi:Cu(I)/Ag(I) efflux system membrane fusion protein